MANATRSLIAVGRGSQGLWTKFRLKPRSVCLCIAVISVRVGAQTPSSSSLPSTDLQSWKELDALTRLAQGTSLFMQLPPLGLGALLMYRKKVQVDLKEADKSFDA
jgi:hypothetical protein